MCTFIQSLRHGRYTVQHPAAILKVHRNSRIIPTSFYNKGFSTFNKINIHLHMGFRIISAHDIIVHSTTVSHSYSRKAVLGIQTRIPDQFHFSVPVNNLLKLWLNTLYLSHPNGILKSFAKKLCVGMGYYESLLIHRREIITVSPHLLWL